MDVPIAVGVGLVASFVQSLGLTIQRRSHVHNEALPSSERRSEWQRPLWIAGFVVFLAANISGTIFQIGTLPVVILAPLGAVSLLYNALLARVLLNDFMSQHMVLGSSMIAVGAVMIGYFGNVPEQSHSLADLLALYKRPPFVAFAMLYTLVFVSMLTMAHLTEWQLLWQPTQPARKTRVPPKYRWRNYTQHLWSSPSLAPVEEVSENSSGVMSPVLDEERARLVDSLTLDTEVAKRAHGTLACPSTSKYGSIPLARAPQPAPEERICALELPVNRPTVLALAVAYSATSGSLSGMCLLLAKSGVGLLVLTMQGDNQFNNPMSWILIAVLAIAAFLQLWYLNRSLRLADPVLVCPLAFCFYNISSITLGLVYFDEFSFLGWLDIAFVTLGTALLLWGVWVISLQHTEQEAAPEEVDALAESPVQICWGPGWRDHETQVSDDALERGAASAPLAGPLFVAAAEQQTAEPRRSVD
ncbi:hypothetical protein MVES_001564 [Malassezia vespertilionis]|uniref:Uncharacterized protein n=1 Tax=Malassezia vespertilionis TaxID=2020962 RepID=A0A2N1JDK9_9BASI|nr:hypothetical protein MVES_001564 [Malassezia vespertilionis]